MYTQMSVITC